MQELFITSYSDLSDCGSGICKLGTHCSATNAHFEEGRSVSVQVHSGQTMASPEPLVPLSREGLGTHDMIE